MVLSPTGSVEVARARLATADRRPDPAGGRHRGRPRRGHRAGPGRHAPPLLVLVTDGRATAGGPTPIRGRGGTAADAVRRRRVSAVVVDAEDGPARLGLARRLAESMGARYLTVPELSAGSLDAAVRGATVQLH